MASRGVCAKRVGSGRGTLCRLPIVLTLPVTLHASRRDYSMEFLCITSYICISLGCNPISRSNLCYHFVNTEPDNKEILNDIIKPSIFFLQIPSAFETFQHFTSC